MTHRTSAAALLVLATLVIGSCVSDADSFNEPASGPADPGSDAGQGTVDDAAGLDDVVREEETTAPPDATASADLKGTPVADSTSDASPTSDAESSSDGAPTPDGEPTPDADLAPDAQSTGDSQSVPDTNPPPDAATSPDSGPSPATCLCRFHLAATSPVLQEYVWLTGSLLDPPWPDSLDGGAVPLEYDEGEGTWWVDHELEELVTVEYKVLAGWFDNPGPVWRGPDGAVPGENGTLYVICGQSPCAASE